MANQHTFTLQNGESYFLLENIFENLSVGLELYDGDGNILSVNRKEMEMMGIQQKEDVLGLNIFDNPNVDENVKSALRKGEDTHFVVEYNFDTARQYFPSTLSGIKYFDITISTLRNEKGIIHNYWIVLLDVTERVLWQRKYEMLYSQNVTILESLPVGVELYNKEGRLLYLNQADCQLFGVDADLPQRQNVSIHNNPNLPNEIKEAVKNRTKIVSRFPYKFETVKQTEYYTSSLQESTLRHIECNGTPVFNSKGEFENYVFIVADITDSVVAEEKVLNSKREVEKTMEALCEKNIELAKRKELQEKIFEGMPLPILIKDVEDDFRYVFCNKESRRMFGSSVKGTAYEVMNKKQADRMHETDRQVFLTGKPYFGQERIELKDGRVYETIVQKSIIEDEGKRLLLNVRWDKSLQNDLERRAKVLSISLDALNAYTWYYDIEKNLLTYGDGFEIIGRAPESINNIEKFGNCVHPADRQKCLAMLHSVIRGEINDFSMEYRVDLNGDGRYTWWERRGTVEMIVLDDEPTRYVFGMDIDIESHKETELTLLNNKEEMAHLIRQNEQVLNNTNSGLAFITSDYIVQWENVSVCSTSLSFEAYKKGEYCYKSAHNRDTPCDNCVLQRAMKSHQVEQITFQLQTERTVEVFATPVFGADEEVEGVVVRIDDITERQQMISDLEMARRQAEQSDKLKSAFLANMSHEIRTPLNAIVGFSDLLMTAKNEDEKEQYMQIIKTNNELLLKLINDILDLSKIEAGSVDLKNEKFDLSEYFDELYASMQHRVGNSSVRLLSINPYRNCMVELDRNRFAQILMNYVTNSIKYTPKGFIEMGYEIVEEGIRVYVRDTGIGIPEEKKSKVFHRFEKLDEFAQGTGLGLSICKAIIIACGGRIGFESEYGQGSLFWAVLPCKVHIEADAASSFVHGNGVTTLNGYKTLDAVELGQAEQKTILVAEDIQSNFLLVSALLKDRYKLIHALNGQQAIDIIRAERVDLVLMDMKMPVKNGLTATREIREFNTDIPVIALTAHAFESDRLAALEAGCNEYLAKPINKQKLIYILQLFSC